jgi:branched-chain amino acid aminotransferase
MLNSHSKLNCIAACIQATKAGADEALMLDPHGFVATCNSTHFFVVRQGELWTSTGRYCLHGITRANVLRLARDNGIPAFEKDFSLAEVYDADEAFITGTFAGLTPVAEVDGRRTGEGTPPGPVTARLKALYRELIERECPPA